MAVKMYTVSSQQAVEYKLHCLLVVKCSSDKRLGNAQSNQQPLVVKVKVGRPPGKLAVTKSMECDAFSFSALPLLVGRQEESLACKKTGCWFVCGENVTGAFHTL